MTRFKDLKAENHKLKNEIKQIKKRDWEYTDIKLPHASVIKYNDGTYVMASPISKYNFKLHDDNELQFMIEQSYYRIKDAYTKEAISWMLEGKAYDIENLKILINKELPLDSIIMNPKLLRALEYLIIEKCGIGYFKKLLDNVLYVAKRE